MKASRVVSGVLSGFCLVTSMGCATGEADLGGGSLSDAAVGGYKNSGGSGGNSFGGAAGFPSNGGAPSGGAAGFPSGGTTSGGGTPPLSVLRKRLSFPQPAPKPCDIRPR